MTAFLVVGVLLLCAENETTLPGWKDQQAAQQQERALPKFDKEVLLCSEGAKQEFDGKRSLEAAVKDGVPYRPFCFDYTLETPAKMLLSEREDFRDGKTYDLEAGTNTLYIDNLKTGKTYHYKIVTDSEEFLGFFHTASSTRFVSMPGVSHTRDIGGRENLAGKTVKQGLLIRGTELDGLVNTSFFLQEEAVEGMQADFGFVYEMDLRSATVYNGPYRSVLGEQVGHQFYDAPMYGDIFNQSRAASLQAIFADLAKPENYPMYLHCTHGTDRTGTIVFLLQGVLGMSEEDMLREYRLNSYENPNILSSTSMDVVIRGLQPYEGDTLAEKTVSFLTETVGVTEAQIASIRTIFLGEE